LLIRSKKDIQSPGFALLIIFALMVPMFAMSTFRWDFEHRYLFVFLPLLLIMTAANLEYVARSGFAAITRNRPEIMVATGALVVILTMQPQTLFSFALGDTSALPAHKTTAGFVAESPDVEQAIIIAEDSIATYYYLGRVDYRLQYGPQAALHARVSGERIEDQYTGAEIIGSGPELRNVLCSTSRPVYIIGDGQVSQKLRRRNRDGGIAEVLNSPLVERVFETYPGPAMVWRKRDNCLRN
jgi:hypothetical protein